MASSASMEQWSLTGGRFKCLAISLFFIADGLVNMLTFDPLSDNTAACDGRPATKRLEARIYDVAVVIDPDLKLHDVSACGSADKPSPDVRVALVCGEKRDSTERCQSKRDNCLTTT